MPLLTERQVLEIRSDIVRAWLGQGQLTNVGENFERGGFGFANKILIPNRFLFVQKDIPGSGVPISMWFNQPLPSEIFVLGFQWGSNTGSGRPFLVGGVNMPNQSSFVDDGSTGERTLEDIQMMYGDQTTRDQAYFHRTRFRVPPQATVNHTSLISGGPVTRVELLYHLHDPNLG